MRRTFLRKIGKYGKRNLAANRKLKDNYAGSGITECEIQLDGCTYGFGLGFAHKHKRSWYYDKLELLSSIEETVIACSNCHAQMEVNAKLTKEVFKRLRG